MENAIQQFHFSELTAMAPASLLPIFVTLALSFLIGLEREEHSSEHYYNFGGVRTFPIIGLCGYLIARLSEGQAFLLSSGLLALGVLMALSYRKKMEISASAGMTSEVSGLFTFLMGALISHGELWEASTLAVIVLLLLELKSALEALVKKIPLTEIFTFTRFLLISAVILPIVPNLEFTSLHFNPYHTWLIVVAISGLSYAAYAMEKIFGSKRSVVLAAILGGIYSSTSTTLVLAKRSRLENSKELFSGAILLASGFMYFRLSALLCIFNFELGKKLLLPFLVIGALFCLFARLWMNLAPKAKAGESAGPLQARNPLELPSAFVFALLFSAMGVLTMYTLQYLGSQGIYVLSFLTGLTDVDPFVMSLTQSSGSVLTVHTAAMAIVIAAASNNVMKGVYTAIWGAEGVRKNASLALVAFAFLSLLALFFI